MDATTTPHKSIRLVVDYTIDHLAEAVALVNDAEPLIAYWQHCEHDARRHRPVPRR